MKICWGREKNLSVEVPLGDFFGLEKCRIKLCTSLLVTVNQDAFSYGFNTYFPIPFSDRARIELVIKNSEGAVWEPQYLSALRFSARSLFW